MGEEWSGNGRRFEFLRAWKSFILDDFSSEGGSQIMMKNIKKKSTLSLKLVDKGLAFVDGILNTILKLA